MCGIHLLIEPAEGWDCCDTPPSWLQRRGPDVQGHVVVKDQNHVVTLHASVLRMREEHAAQPFAVRKGMHLAWNGEVYQVNQRGNPDDPLLNSTSILEDVSSRDKSDTKLVANLIDSMISSEGHDPSVSTHFCIAEAIKDLTNAEFSFCILDQDFLYFGRDRFGRRSLLERRSEDGRLLELSSVATETTAHNSSSCDSSAASEWKEVSPGCLYRYDWKESTTEEIKLADNCLLPNELAQCLELTPPINAGHVNRDNVPASMWNASIKLQHLLSEAIRRRLNGPTALLFSGGLDSVVLAGLALQLLPSSSTLVLVNVAFTDSERNQNGTKQIPADTLAARESFQDLKNSFPDHSIDFIQREVDWTEIVTEEGHIRQLIFPKSSVMDLNISTAFWFSAEAVDCRILLTGLGADEQMGGYGRHRKVWASAGEAGLRNELDLDIQRLWDRNLGRDDRVLSDHGKEARFPYLDTSVVQFLSEQSLSNVCDFNLPPGEGDKRILRVIALRLGLPSASRAVKRAIQFGSRISHVSDKRRFGSRRKASGTSSA